VIKTRRNDRVVRPEFHGLRVRKPWRASALA
jgi:hypothetical protein